MKGSLKLAVAMAAGLLMAAASTTAHAVNLNWTSKTCLIVDGTFQVCKPSTSWDTQTKEIIDEPVRWVLHRKGPNPIIKLLYKTDVKGKTAHDYAKWVRQDLELRGLTIGKVENRTINGRNVTLINASDPENSGKLNYLVAVYRDQNKGVQMECTAAKENFSFFSQEFMAAIDSVHFIH